MHDVPFGHVGKSAVYKGYDTRTQPIQNSCPPCRGNDSPTWASTCLKMPLAQSPCFVTAVGGSGSRFVGPTTQVDCADVLGVIWSTPGISWGD